MSSLIIVLQRTAEKYAKNYNARAQPLLSFLNLFICDVAVVVFLNSLLNLLAEVYFSMRSFAVYLGMIFFLLSRILSDCNLELQAINFTLQQEVNDLREKLNKLQHQQPACKLASLVIDFIGSMHAKMNCIKKENELLFLTV